VEDGTGESGLVSGRHAMRILSAATLRSDECQHAALAEHCRMEKFNGPAFLVPSL
jgi:hypothetical protein